MHHASQMTAWSTPLDAAYSVLGMSDYDYDQPLTESVDFNSARLFEIIFMFAVSNLLLWMFLAIIMDTYRFVVMAEAVTMRNTPHRATLTNPALRPNFPTRAVPSAWRWGRRTRPRSRTSSPA